MNVVNWGLASLVVDADSVLEILDSEDQMGSQIQTCTRSIDPDPDLHPTPPTTSQDQYTRSREHQSVIQSNKRMAEQLSIPPNLRKVTLNREDFKQIIESNTLDLEDIGRRAASDVRAETLRILEEEGVTVRKVARRLADALNAEFQEAKLAKDGEFRYSSLMADNKIRLEAVKIAAEMLEMKEPDKSDKTNIILIDKFEDNRDQRQINITAAPDYPANRNPGPAPTSPRQ